VRALVTGATGFVGSYLTRRLLDDGVEVAVLRRPTSDPWRLAPVLGRLRTIEGDLEAQDAVRRPVLDFAPDTVFHLAWHGVGGAARDDAAQIDRNLMATVALARLAAEAGARTWVGLGSQAEYGPYPHAIDERAEARPTTLYGAAKLCAGLLARQVSEAASMRFIWLRLFSSYGPLDNPEWMIPYLIRSLLRRERPALTAGEQRWDFLYVDDAAEAIVAVARCPAAAGFFNLGSGEAPPLRSTVERVRDAIDPQLPLGFGEVPYRSDQVMHLQADIRRLQSVTGWRPQTDLSVGIGETVEYHRGRTARRPHPVGPARVTS
jgi:nucleoside-diphosphate-sugar epimerase